MLDLGCGTGRLSGDLARRGYDVAAVDASPEMLRIARARTAVPAVQGDGFAVPLGDGAFDAVVALRLLFHYSDVRSILREMRRLARPGASVIFDTYRWSPRALVPLAPERWGGRVFIHSEKALRREALELGLSLSAAEHCFLFSPYVYRLLPLVTVHALARLESILPPSLRARTFWRFVRT
ncbi:MAG: class I SAM-dependent methyltransferase [Chloroflexi bacterium]|nr:class I SAM-dependent methyltransferase [Chloroflexota bacterium]